jgi:hypothetical protein
MVTLTLKGITYSLPSLRWKFHRKVQAEVLALMKSVDHFRQIAETLLSDDFSSDDAFAILEPMGNLIDNITAVFAQSMLQAYQDECAEVIKIGGNPMNVLVPLTSDDLADLIEIGDWSNLVVVATQFVQAMTPGEAVPAGQDAAVVAENLGTETPTL